MREYFIVHDNIRHKFIFDNFLKLILQVFNNFIDRNLLPPDSQRNMLDDLNLLVVTDPCVFEPLSLNGIYLTEENRVNDVHVLLGWVFPNLMHQEHLWKFRDLVDIWNCLLILVQLLCDNIEIEVFELSLFHHFKLDVLRDFGQNSQKILHLLHYVLDVSKLTPLFQLGFQNLRVYYLC